MYFKNKKVLIIGGTGTIGKSLLRAILLQSPKFVRVFSRDEYKQYLLQNEMGSCQEIQYCLGDVRDEERVFQVMDGIDYVFHAAAMKHVPACEYNPYEAVLTNIKGTYNVIHAAIAKKVKKAVFTSTDKAIAPTNTYGATKLAAERLIASAQTNKGSHSTTFSSVRFGNVMGSRGSVIPLFTKQIRENKRITVTDLNMSRFMMTLEEATNLTMKALQYSTGGEVFVLKMPVVHLQDLAKVVIEETCSKYDIKCDSIGIEEIGLRPGEKMYEELMTEDESLSALELPDMFVIPAPHTNAAEYKGAKIVSKGTYRSDDQSPMSLEDLRNKIIKEKLI